MTTVETPKAPLDQIEVMDLTGNKISDLSFISGFPKLVSLTLKDITLTSLDGLKPLSEIKTLKVIELPDDFHTKVEPAFETPEALRAKLFEMFPDMLGINGFDIKGEELEDGFGEEEEDFLLEELNSDEDVDEDAEEEGEKKEEGETKEEADAEAEEPPAKKQKVAEE